MTHILKTWPQFFEDILKGTKTFELRYNDRDFKVGDRLILQEWDPEIKEPTGRDCWKRVTYILDSFQGLLIGYCILGIES